MPQNTIIDLIQLSTRGDWTLWKFIIAPRTERFIWTHCGRFPTYLFDPAVVLHSLDKTEDSALQEMDRLEESGQFDKH